MNRRNSLNPCAASDCRGGSGRQRKLYAHEIDKITGAARLLINESRNTAMICTYCGAVYIDNDRKQLLGKLDPPMGEEGWHPLAAYSG